MHVVYLCNPLLSKLKRLFLYSKTRHDRHKNRHLKNVATFPDLLFILYICYTDSEIKTNDEIFHLKNYFYPFCRSNTCLHFKKCTSIFRYTV